MLKKPIITILISSYLVLSCQNEPLEQNSNQILNDSKNGTIINGRFYFSSKESLKKAVSDLESMNENRLEQKFKNLYLKGFRSHSPIVNSNDESLISLLANDYEPTRNFAKSSTGIAGADEEEEEDSDDFAISDPILASLINANNEIIVRDSIYKITPELGVLSARLKDTTYIYNYISRNSIATSKPGRTSKNAATVVPAAPPIDPSQPYLSPAKPPCELRAALGGRMDVEGHVTRYIAPYNPVECNVSNSSNTSTKTYVPQLSEDQILQNRIDALPNCEAKRTSWFQSLFGTNLSCISYFDDKHRIKNEFWNQKWGFYSSVGIQTRVQVKKFWVWWASDADELYLGVNRIFMKYNYPAPTINYLNTFYSDPEVPVYMYQGEFNVRDYNGIIRNAPFVTANSGLPFFNFGGDVLNIYIRKIPFLDKYNIQSESNIKELYKLGINYLKQKVNNNGSQEFVVSYQKTPTEIEVLYFGERYKKTNSNSIKRTFYQDTEFVVSVAYNTTPYDPNSSTPYGDWTYTVEKPDVSNARKYTYFEFDIYGMGRKGDTWSGTKTIKY